MALSAERIQSQATLFPQQTFEVDQKWLRTQRAYLEHSVKSGRSLDLILELDGFSYNDLRYETYGPLEQPTITYRTLLDFYQKPNDIPVVSLFSGAGGLDLGFEAAGFSHVALVEHNGMFCETVRLNRPSWTVLGPPLQSGDVSNREEMLEELRRVGVEDNFDGVFIGGPPCQPFSIASNQRFNKSGDNFKRTGFNHETSGTLLFDYVWLIEQFRPRVFLIENVAGLLDIDGGEELSNALSRLTQAGYTCTSPLVVNAADYGVPQYRERLFIVGARTKSEFMKPLPSRSHIPCYLALEDISEDAENHITRKHKAESVLRYMALKYGQRDHLGRVDRLNPNMPSKTVIAGGSGGGGRSHLHPFIPRTLSVRESARLQTFPDDYVFVGPSARQFTQVGNAVPPVLATQLAQAIYNSFYR